MASSETSESEKPIAERVFNFFVDAAILAKTNPEAANPFDKDIKALLPTLSPEQLRGLIMSKGVIGSESPPEIDERVEVFRCWSVCQGHTALHKIAYESYLSRSEKELAALLRDRHISAQKLIGLDARPIRYEANDLGWPSDSDYVDEVSGKCMEQTYVEV